MAGQADRVHEGNELRAQVRSPRIYLIFNCVFAALFAGIFLLIILNNTHTQMAVWLPWLILSAVVGILFVLLVSRLFLMMPAPGKRAEVTTVIIVFVLLIAVQAVVGWLLRVDPAQSPAYGPVYTYAQEFVLNGTKPGEYFVYNPTDAPYYVILTSFFSLLRMFGVTNFVLPSLILNIILIDIGLLQLYLCARSLFGAKRAIFLLAMYFFTLPLLLYVPILSAETLALPFVTTVVYEWMLARRTWREGHVGDAARRFLLLSAFAALGSLFRTAVLIVWIAVAIDLLVLLAGKARVRIALGGLGLLLVVIVVCNWFVHSNKSLPRYDFDSGIPVTEKMMAGLDGYGTYNEEDFNATLAQPDRAARRDYNLEEMGARLGDMGVLGVLGHLGDKLAYTFEDGTDYASLILDRGAIQPGVLQTYVGYYGDNYMVVGYVAFALQAALLFWVTVGAVKAVIRRNEALTFVRVTLFGLVLFLMIFETSSQALVTFMPLFLLCALEASPIVRAPVTRGRRLAPVAALPAAQEEDADTMVLPELADAAEQAQDVPADLSMAFAALPAQLSAEKMAVDESGQQGAPLAAALEDAVPPEGMMAGPEMEPVVESTIGQFEIGSAVEPALEPAAVAEMAAPVDVETIENAAVIMEPTGEPAAETVVEIAEPAGTRELLSVEEPMVSAEVTDTPQPAFAAEPAPVAQPVVVARAEEQFVETAPAAEDSFAQAGPAGIVAPAEGLFEDSMRHTQIADAVAVQDKTRRAGLSEEAVSDGQVASSLPMATGMAEARVDLFAGMVQETVSPDNMAMNFAEAEEAVETVPLAPEEGLSPEAAGDVAAEMAKAVVPSVSAAVAVPDGPQGASLADIAIAAVPPAVPPDAVIPQHPGPEGVFTGEGIAPLPGGQPAFPPVAQTPPNEMEPVPQDSGVAGLAVQGAVQPEAPTHSETVAPEAPGGAEANTQPGAAADGEELESVWDYL